jgi:Cytosol aminopeptidase family, catalytic domain
VISSASIIDSDRASPRYSSVPSVEAWDRDEIAAAGMGAPAAVARGSHEEPQLMVLRYEPPDARRESAERAVDVATLTCGAVTALGFTYAALFVNNEDWAVQLQAAAEQRASAYRGRCCTGVRRADAQPDRDLVSSAEKRPRVARHRKAGVSPGGRIDLHVARGRTGAPAFSLREL